MKNFVNFKNKKIILGVLLGILVLGAVYFFFLNSQKGINIPGFNVQDSEVDKINTNDWLTFESQAPFVFKYPTTWGLEATEYDEKIQGMHLVGPEGEIFLTWGEGLDKGWACDNWSKVQLKNAEVNTCDLKLNNGKEAWEQMSKKLDNGVAFRGRAYANNPAVENRAVILAILSTLEFKNK